MSEKDFCIKAIFQEISDHRNHSWSCSVADENVLLSLNIEYCGTKCSLTEILYRVESGTFLSRENSQMLRETISLQALLPQNNSNKREASKVSKKKKPNTTHYQPKIGRRVDLKN